MATIIVGYDGSDGSRASLDKAIDLAGTGLQGFGAEFVAGMDAAAVSGFVVIRWLLRYLQRHDFTIFLWYRVAVAVLVLLLILTGAREPTI